MWKFEEFVKMVRRISGTLGVAALAFWIIFMMVYMLLQSSEKEQKAQTSAPPPAVQAVPARTGCLHLGDKVIICDTPYGIEREAP